MRLYVTVVLLLLSCFAGYAVQDTTVAGRRTVQPEGMQGLLDSVAASQAARRQFVSDSLSMLFIKRQDPSRRNLYIEQMMKEYVYQGYGFLDIKSPKRILVRAPCVKPATAG